MVRFPYLKNHYEGFKRFNRIKGFKRIINLKDFKDLMD